MGAGAGQSLLDDFGHPGGRYTDALLRIDGLADTVDCPPVASRRPCGGPCPRSVCGLRPARSAPP
jgi:hypothetical protein